QRQAATLAPLTTRPRRTPGTAVAAPVTPAAVAAPPAAAPAPARPAPAHQNRSAAHRPAWSGGGASRSTPPPGRAKTPARPPTPKGDTSSTATHGNSATTPAAQRKPAPDATP